MSSMPIESAFRLPNSLPAWPTGDGFGKGIIDLGGLLVSEVSTFSKVFETKEGGPSGNGATFFEPSIIPDGFSLLGYYAQPNNMPLFGSVLVAKDTSPDGSSAGALKAPLDYTQLLNIKKDNTTAYFWLPVAPSGYKAVGNVITIDSQKPALDKIGCVRDDFTDIAENDEWIWGSKGLNVYSTRPKVRGIQALGLSTGTFMAQLSSGGTELSSSVLSCLKNVNKLNKSGMPNLDQIKELIKVYSPFIYFDSKEEYFPSSVTWFIKNGALLYTRGKESSPVAVEPTGANLPQGSSNNDSYWLDLPTSEAEKERVKKGNLQDFTSYIHVKPMFGSTYTDLVFWVFYPFNGPARAKVEFVTVNLGTLGQHIGDWEHVTLRISNFTGELKKVYFSQHNTGTWIKGSQVEFQDGNKPITYSSFNGHAAYPKAGDVLQGTKNIGLRNDTDKGKIFVDTGASFSIVSAEYLGTNDVVEPAWLNYTGKWGPKIKNNVGTELSKVENALPGKLKAAMDKVVGILPAEALGEDGPIGPKRKEIWTGDERS
ncbi:unnamed protein product [Cuscuta epithymum]|uniref:Vacuolar protein sorting-associated protein 62 n=1 Tax=Cuscuta epithymum TaxID=186058 RepID=A0AAV0F0E0_9ASTE|nr:unnamed protein product [Cuscuta epithymum]